MDPTGRAATCSFDVLNILLKPHANKDFTRPRKITETGRKAARSPGSLVVRLAKNPLFSRQRATSQATDSGTTTRLALMIASEQKRMSVKYLDSYTSNIETASATRTRTRKRVTRRETEQHASEGGDNGVSEGSIGSDMVLKTAQRATWTQKGEYVSSAYSKTRNQKIKNRNRSRGSVKGYLTLNA